MLVNYLYCLYKITFMLESEKRVEWKALHLYAFRIMLWISIISCTTFSLLNLPTFTGQKPQLMLLLACAHWEFPNIVKVWYFASRRAMLAFFILADGQRWATIVFDPLERNDTEQIYRWEVRTGKIMESLEHKTGHPKRIQVQDHRGKLTEELTVYISSCQKGENEKNTRYMQIYMKR